MLALLCAGCAGLFGRPYPKNFDLRLPGTDNDPVAGAAVTVISPDTSFRAEARYDSLRGLYAVDSMPLENSIVMADRSRQDDILGLMNGLGVEPQASETESTISCSATISPTISHLSNKLQPDALPDASFS